MKPIGKYILIRQIKEEVKTESGLLLSTQISKCWANANKDEQRLFIQYTTGTNKLISFYGSGGLASRRKYERRRLPDDAAKRIAG